MARTSDGEVVCLQSWVSTIDISHETFSMAKTNRKLKKANHGRRPASAKARKAKRKKYRT
jgi:hypothetical protein